MTYIQLQKCIEMSDRGYHDCPHPYNPIDPNAEPVYGGPLYMANDEGTVYEIESDGSIILIKQGISSTD